MSHSENLDKIILAVDLSSKEEIESLLKTLTPKPKVLKFGLEVIASLGIDSAIKLLTDLCPESKLFLDFKLHDIPNTVQRAIDSLVEKHENKIEYLTVHSFGGSSMLQRSLKAAGSSLNIVAVTVLTSHSNEDLSRDFAMPPSLNISSLVLSLANIAYQSGVKWLVCSPQESKILKTHFPSIKLVTPGIRPFHSKPGDDQARPMGLVEAFQRGSDLVVIGRPIYEADNPQEAWTRLLNLT